MVFWFFKVFLSTLLVTKISEGKTSRIRRCATNLSPNECQYMYFGGTSGLHHYICCNNCPASPQLDNVTDALDSTCDGHTYQSASGGQYCGPCGFDNGVGWCGNKFFCGGCKRQQLARELCERQWDMHSIPGFCWIFARCFRGKCAENSLQRRRRAASNSKHNYSDGEGFCGDAICQDHPLIAENSSSCPIDCCPLTNPDRCTFVKGRCQPRCCGEPDCCSTAKRKPKLLDVNDCLDVGENRSVTFL